MVRECVLPADQAATIPQEWRARPIPLQVNPGDFSDAEVQLIARAADTWNQFYLRTHGFQVFSFGQFSQGTPLVPTVGALCSQNAWVLQPQTGLFQAGMAVTLYKQRSWLYDRSIMAQTTKCSLSASPRRSIVNAMVELNFQDYAFTGSSTNTSVPDLQSIVLHELGHLVGLEHSCELGAGSAGSPSCYSLTQDQLPYYLALMFPSFTSRDASGNTRYVVKRGLMPNDQGRANCLFN